MARHNQRQPTRKADPRQPLAAELRIIGGRFRRRALRYDGRGDTRPMKHRVREAIFNLVGTEVAGKDAWDLFAGTGAVGLEALSRGAAHATFVEQHVPTARLIRENIESLGVAHSTDVVVTSVFLWAQRDLAVPDEATEPATAVAARAGGSAPSPPVRPWITFCCPPYDFYSTRRSDMLDLVRRLLKASPGGSLLVVEADGRFDFSQLPVVDTAEGSGAGWDVRAYPPAVVGVLRKPAMSVD